jgi:hypothetical protein
VSCWSGVRSRVLPAVLVAAVVSLVAWFAANPTTAGIVGVTTFVSAALVPMNQSKT